MKKLVVGDWITMDDEIYQVASLSVRYYEPYDVDGELYAKRGKKLYDEIVLRRLCDESGRIRAGVPEMWYLDFILGDIKLPSDEDLMKIQRIKETHPEKFKKWADRDITCKQVEDVYFEVEPNKGKTICKALKKCCKSLPDSFTFKDLADHAATLGICIGHCTDDCSSFDNYVSFSLERVVGEDIDKHHLYRKVTSVDYCDEEEDKLFYNGNLFNFEMVFLSMARLVHEYANKTGDHHAVSFFEIMHPTFIALIHQQFKDNAMAKEFFKWIPKINFSKDVAYNYVIEFLEKQSSQYHLENMLDALKTSEWKEIYEDVYKPVGGIKKLIKRCSKSCAYR